MQLPADRIEIIFLRDLSITIEKTGQAATLLRIDISLTTFHARAWHVPEGGKF